MPRRKLSNRQRKHIKAIQERRRQRLDDRASQVAEQAVGDEPRSGVVITRHGQNLMIEDKAGQLWHCLSRQNIGDPVCGDQVVWQPASEKQGVITALQPRSSALIRPTYSGEARALAANITQLVIVLAPEPPPSQYLVDQYLVASENINTQALITLNKKDLLSSRGADLFSQDFQHYARIGYPVILISAKNDHGLDPLYRHLQGETSILVGQSGVGKSSLANALLPDLDIQVGRLSEASGLGRHTTSTTTLYNLPHGGHLIDSPGVRSFRLGAMEQQQLEQGFREFRPILGHCRFSNCSHTHEPGCALLEAVASGAIDPRRMANFQHMSNSSRNRT
jgi:ribosome biogenesis GTPase